MVQLVVIVKPFRVRAVLEALQCIDLDGATLREVMGFGRQKNRLQRYLGSEFNTSFLPKVELTLYLDERHVDEATRAIVGQARTGRMGDGKILVLPCTSPEKPARLEDAREGGE